MVKVKRTTSTAIQSLGAEWQLLAEIGVTGEPDQKLLAVEQVIEVIESIHLPARHMEQLKMAVTRAVVNEAELVSQENPSQPVSIRVMASPQAVEAWDNQQLRGASGWGFFVIEKMTEEAWLRGEAYCHKIELFLYLEGEIQDRWKEKK